MGSSGMAAGAPHKMAKQHTATAAAAIAAAGTAGASPAAAEPLLLQKGDTRVRFQAATTGATAAAKAPAKTSAAAVFVSKDFEGFDSLRKFRSLNFQQQQQQQQELQQELQQEQQQHKDLIKGISNDMLLRKAASTPQVKFTISSSKDIDSKGSSSNNNGSSKRSSCITTSSYSNGLSSSSTAKSSSCDGDSCGQGFPNLQGSLSLSSSSKRSSSSGSQLQVPPAAAACANAGLKETPEHLVPKAEAAVIGLAPTDVPNAPPTRGLSSTSRKSSSSRVVAFLEQDKKPVHHKEVDLLSSKCRVFVAGEGPEGLRGAYSWGPPTIEGKQQAAAAALTSPAKGDAAAAAATTDGDDLCELRSSSSSSSSSSNSSNIDSSSSRDEYDSRLTLSLSEPGESEGPLGAPDSQPWGKTPRGSRWHAALSCMQQHCLPLRAKKESPVLGRLPQPKHSATIPATAAAAAVTAAAAAERTTQHLQELCLSEGPCMQILLPGPAAAEEASLLETPHMPVAWAETETEAAAAAAATFAAAQKKQDSREEEALLSPAAAADAAAGSIFGATPLQHPLSPNLRLQQQLLQQQIQLLQQQQQSNRQQLQHQQELLQQEQLQLRNAKAWRLFPQMQLEGGPLEGPRRPFLGVPLKSPFRGPSAAPSLFCNTLTSRPFQLPPLASSVADEVAAAREVAAAGKGSSSSSSSSTSVGLPLPRLWTHRGSRRRALCVGCLYTGTFCELKGSATDARRWATMAAETLGMTEIMTLCEGQPYITKEQAPSSGFPSLQNIVRGLEWLAEGSEAGDVLLLMFSGCSCALVSSEQPEGPPAPYSLALLPADFSYLGGTRFVSSSCLLSLVSRLADGVQFCAVLDCGFGGRLLPFASSLSVSGRDNISIGFQQPAAAMVPWLFPWQQQQQQQQRGAAATKFAGLFRVPQLLQTQEQQREEQKRLLLPRGRGTARFLLTLSDGIAKEVQAQGREGGALTCLLLEALRRNYSPRQSFFSLAVAAASLQREIFDSDRAGFVSRPQPELSLCLFFESPAPLHEVSFLRHGRASPPKTPDEQHAARMLSVHHSRAEATSMIQGISDSAGKNAYEEGPLGSPRAWRDSKGFRAPREHRPPLFPTGQPFSGVRTPEYAPAQAVTPRKPEATHFRVPHLQSQRGLYGRKTIQPVSGLTEKLGVSERTSHRDKDRALVTRRGSFCSLASIAASSVVAGANPLRGGSWESGHAFRVYVHSVKDLEAGGLGDSPVQIRVSATQQQQHRGAEEEMHAAAKVLLSSEQPSSKLTKPVMVNGLCFLPIGEALDCPMPSASKTELLVGLVRRGSWGPSSDQLVGYTAIDLGDQRLASLEQWLLRSASTPALGVITLKLEEGIP